ncbi:MAG: DUF5009 domain-containing protein [Bacteroidota bacterium]
MDGRLRSLDVFRGITIAGMILVNNPGSWGHVYPPLLHAEWHGITPTDWIFPFFLFIVGVAIPLAVSKRLSRGDSKQKVLLKSLSRAGIILGLGLFLAAFPNFGMPAGIKGIQWLHYGALLVLIIGLFLLGTSHVYSNKQLIRRIGTILFAITALILLIIGIQEYDLTSMRFPGVLQRIAIVYAFSAIAYLYLDWKQMVWLSVGLLLGYWALMSLVLVPGIGAPNLEPENNIGAWLDRMIFGNHLWVQSKTWDPEGLISTIPAIASGISGVLVGIWIKSDREAYQKVAGILAMGVIIVALGWIWHLAFPINKKLWTSSYVLHTTGVAMLFLGVTYWLIDVLKISKWSWPFEVYGMNALFVFVLSGFIAKLFYKIYWFEAGEVKVTLGSWIYNTFFTPFLGDYQASLAYAIANVLFFFLLSWLMYRKRVFVKI